MTVKLKQPRPVYNLPEGYEFTVDNFDDGEYSLMAFYQGWVKNLDGHEYLATFDQEDCEIIDWR